MKRAATFLILLLGTGCCACAQITYTGITTADAFLPTGSPNNPIGTDLTGLNLGGAGTLAVAPTTSSNGEVQSVIRFDLSSAVTLFDSTYGTNNWIITGISLKLTSNYGTAGVQPNNPIFDPITGGKFVIEWLSNNDWTEGTGTPNLPTTDGVSYDSLPELLSGPHEILCTNTYTPPGNNVPVTYDLPLAANLVANASNGGNVSFLFYAADDQIYYLFNSHSYGRGNEPLILVTAMPNLKLVAGVFTNGAFRLTGKGGINAQYHLQASSDLSKTNWIDIGTATSDSNGTVQFDDVNATNFTQRFYRLSQ